MAAPLDAILCRSSKRIIKTSITKIPNQIEIILKKNQFLAKFGYPTLLDSNQTTLPFKQFQLKTGSLFSMYLDQFLKGKGIPQMTHALTKKFRHSLLELFQNAAMHSESEYGIFVCGQFYPYKQRLDFTIADAGIGIRETVRRYFQNKISSCSAIRWALAEGHTTKRGQKQPGGLGLKLIKDFIQLNQGKIQIVSRFGFYEYSTAGESFSKMEEDFPGTCVNIEINTADKNSYCLNSELKTEDIF